MAVYQKLGGVVGMTAPVAATISPTDLDTSFTGNSNVSFVKVVNADLADHVQLSWQTSGALTGESNPTVIAAGATEYIQVAPLNNTGPVYFYLSGTAGNIAYITPIAVLGA
jgi:hypothetical protein